MCAGSADRERDESSQRRKTMLERFWEWARRLFGRGAQLPGEAAMAARAEADYRRADGVNLTCNIRLAAGRASPCPTPPSISPGRGAESARRARRRWRRLWRTYFPRAQSLTAQALGTGGRVLLPCVADGKVRFQAVGQDPLFRHRHARRAHHRRHGAGRGGPRWTGIPITAGRPTRWKTACRPSPPG